MSDVLQKVASCPTLPSLPTVAVEVLELTKDQSVSLNEIARVVQNDQALAAKVLRTINSSYYGLSTPCPSIQRALGYLGLNTVRSLVLGFSLVDSFKGALDEEQFDVKAHWRRAVYGATSARLIAEHTRVTDPDEAFIASMLQDIGTLAAVVALKEDYAKVVTDTDGDHFRLVSLERDEFGFDHAEAGAELATSWRLPDSLISSIRHHHDPETTPDEHRRIVQVVTCSAYAAEALREEPDEAHAGKFRALMKDWFQVLKIDADQILVSAAERARELSRLFQLDTGAAPDVSALMAEAQEQQLVVQMQAERERQDLERTASELTIQTTTDALTGAANRKVFDESLADFFEKAAHGKTLAVLFMDADKFKSVNDTHGHQAGDAVLVELAKRVADAVGDDGIVCRYGGEEFAVLLPDADLRNATKIAEKIRKAVESPVFDLRGVDGAPDELPITVSVGVACRAPDTYEKFTTPTALVKAADDAVYAAKKSGRNCTRVFMPRKYTKAKPSPDAAPAKAPQPPKNFSATVASGEDFSVLVIDDDPLHRTLLTTVLSDIEGVAVECAGSGEDAIEKLALGQGPTEHAAKPDLVLVDLGLPGISGVELIRAIRGEDRFTLTPVIVVSGAEEQEFVRQSLAAGANAFINKSSLSQNPTGKLRELTAFWSSAVAA